MRQAKATIDGDEVRRWAEEPKGRPSEARTAKAKGGILGFGSGGKDEKLKEISWDEFSPVFDQNNIGLLRQGKGADDKTRRFFKFVEREDKKR